MRLFLDIPILGSEMGVILLTDRSFSQGVTQILFLNCLLVPLEGIGVINIGLSVNTMDIE